MKQVNSLILVLSYLVLSCDSLPTDDFKRDNPTDLIIPKLEFIHPASNYTNYHKDPIQLKILVQDQFYPPDELDVNLYSDHDSLLTLSPLKPDASGSIETLLENLSNNAHYILAEVINPEGYARKDSILIYNNAPPGVEITNINLYDNSYIELEWEKSIDPDFQSYNIFRRNSLDATTRIAVIQDPEIISYRDYAPLDTLYQYYMSTNSNSFSMPNYSLVVSQQRNLFLSEWINEACCAPVYIGFSNVQKYPDHPILLMQKLHKIIAFNYSENSVLGHLDLENSLTSVGNNGEGMEIYVIPKSRNELRIYDAFTLELKESHSINHTIDFETNNNGFLFFTFGSTFGTLTGIPRNDISNPGTVISGFNGSYLSMSKSSNDIYLMSDIYSSDLYHATYDINGNITEINSWPYDTGPSITPLNFEVHPNNLYVVSNTRGHIFEAGPSLLHQKTLNNNANYVDFTFDETGNILFAAEKSGWIDIYHNLTYTGRIRVRDEPRFLEYYEGKLIIFAFAELVPDHMGVLVIEYE